MMSESMCQTPMYVRGDIVSFTLNMPCCDGTITVVGAIEVIDTYGNVRYDVLGRFLCKSANGKWV